jgi:hypothetical protein
VWALQHNIPHLLRKAWFRVLLGSAAGLSAMFAGAVLFQQWQMVQGSHAATRSFYGSLMVIDEGAGEAKLRTLIDGTIDHGSQFLHPSRRSWITTYFAPGSGVSYAFQALEPGPRKVGIVGLGAGTLASYGRKGDEFHYFEINPDVVTIAQRDFGFLPDSQAGKQIFLGDARLSLEDMPRQGYHMLILDAFSSDAVPVHLLTREAFTNYFQHLRQDGILCINVANRYLNLIPVLAQVADDFGKEGWVIASSSDMAKGVAGAKWVILTDRRNPAPGFGIVRGIGQSTQALPERVLWTDDHSNLFSLIKR